MKGQLGYVAIIAVLIVSVVAIYYGTQSTATTKEETTTEGSLVSSEDFNFFLLKTLNQSIEFIAQRTAYEMALNGGFANGREVPWSYNYPQMSDLEYNLQSGISDHFPSSFKRFNTWVDFENSNIIVSEQANLWDSQYFDVRGYANLSIYDETVRSKTFSNFNINSRAVSSYFRLLWVAREILTNTNYNSSLDDAKALQLLLERDFTDLGFTITASGDILDITIEDLCYPPNIYCLAPLNSDEPKTKKDIGTGAFIPYENLKLRFKAKTTQTSSPTPPLCDFNVSLDSVLGSVESGHSVNPPVSVNVINLGTTNDPVGLTAKVYNKTTMQPDNSITVTFDDNGKPAPYPTLMRIDAPSYTLGGDYLINVTADGCTNQKRFVTYNLTVNPAMTFSIDADPLTLTTNSGQQSNSTNINVNITSGTSEEVLLLVIGIPSGITSRTLTPNRGFPNFTSVLTLTTDGSIREGEYWITIMGVGGGSVAQKKFKLYVVSPFKFNFFFQDHNCAGGGCDNPFRTKTSTTHLGVETIGGTPETVGFSYDVVNSAGNTDPSNFQITVSIFSPNPCLLTAANPNCYPTMNISTTQNTPADTYHIHINAIAASYSRQLPFDLTVIWGCGDGIITTGQDCSGDNKNNKDCSSLGYNLGGTLSCYPPGDPNQCKFNTTDCVGCKKFTDKSTCESYGCYWCPKCWDSIVPVWGLSQFTNYTVGDRCTNNYIDCRSTSWLTQLPAASCYGYDFEPPENCTSPDYHNIGFILWSNDLSHSSSDPFKSCDTRWSDSFAHFDLGGNGETSNDYWYSLGGVINGKTVVSGKGLVKRDSLTFNTSYIWAYDTINHLSRAIECCRDNSCNSGQLTGEYNIDNNRMEKNFGILNDTDQTNPDYPYIIFRKAWCGGDNLIYYQTLLDFFSNTIENEQGPTNCLLCYCAEPNADNTTCAGTKWYVCKYNNTAGSYPSFDDVKIVQINDKIGPWNCSMSGDWVAG